MLAKIRKNLRAFSVPLWIVALSFVGTIFLVWGRGTFSGPSGREVARVNGYSIDISEFGREYNFVVRELQNTFGEDYKKMFTEKGIKLRALERLIERTLLLQTAEKEGIKVSEWAVAKEISEMPVFQKNGKFSEERFKEVLKANRLSPEAFWKQVREDLTIRKLIEVISYSPSVTEFESKILYAKMFGKRKFAFKLFKTSSYNPEVTEKEIAEYYNSHKENFAEKGKESYFLIEIPRGEKNSQETARLAYRLAKEGKFAELETFSPKPAEDAKLIEEKFKGKNFGFYSDKEKFYVFFKKPSKKYKPLPAVKEAIVKRIKEKKAWELARKSAEEFSKNGKALSESTGMVSKEEFIKRFKPINFEDVDMLFSVSVGKRLVIPTSSGFGVFSPQSEVKVEGYDKEKMENLKALIENYKRESNYATFINLLRQRARIKVNQELLK
jgi:peptidyl-prolyl cis-trans isomerase D